MVVEVSPEGLDRRSRSASPSKASSLAQQARSPSVKAESASVPTSTASPIQNGELFAAPARFVTAKANKNDDRLREELAVRKQQVGAAPLYFKLVMPFLFMQAIE